MSLAIGIPPLISQYAIRPPAEVGAEALPEIQRLQPSTGIAETNPAQPAGESFSNVLGRMVQEVSASQGAANDAVAALQSGHNVSLHQAVIAMEEANISFQLMVEVRNKLLDSYQELMRMQV
ncbi:MAG TPA: flagellar hook-basal body complex protein FliE [Verrucomicrobiae bacterium]|nr:flagellar hook-basal body complex protein FliE [Verrucomicrobiae bacterium]